MIRKANAVVLLSMLAGAAGCEAIMGNREDERACPQTYEFGNHGCAEVIGRVLGTGGQPLHGISVYPRHPEHGHVYNSPYSTTQADGRFHLRMTRYGQSGPVAAPDTFTVYLVARAMPAGRGGVSPARDSVLVQVELARVGQVPTPAEVEIRLAHP